jgi:hypothetical protein
MRRLLIALLLVGCGSASGLEVPEATDASAETDGDTCGGASLKCGDAGCVDPRFDPLNCGGCGLACKEGEVCSLGTCSTSCAAPLLRCGATCVDVRHDPTNCGGCGNKCIEGEACGPTGCVAGCTKPLLECAMACVDTKNDPTNCGTCGNTCKSGFACSDGKCTDTCVFPLQRCGLSCVSLAYDPNNCGICGFKCPGTPCLEGGCGVVDKTDDDEDTISSFHESKGIGLDTDKDGTPDYLDLDSDGDGIPDKEEAGDLNVVTPPIDSDGDTKPDFQDTDSDNDGLTDKDERAKYKTSPTKKDTDGDGYTDTEEVLAGTDPLDPASNPGTIGGFSFDLPYKGLPRTQELTFNPRIKRADVAFIVDTTSSMGGSITGIRSQLSKIATDLKTKIPDTAFGVMDFRDMPLNPYGDTTDFPARLRQRITTSLTDAQTGVNALSAAGGRDIPEAQISGLFQAATGEGMRSLSGAVWTPKFDPKAGFDAGKGHGDIGGMGFRKDAAPIFVLVTDAVFHHAPGDPDAPSASGGFDYYSAASFGTASDQMPKTVKQTLDAMAAISAKLIGVSVRLGTGEAARRQEEYFALKTGTYTTATGGTCPHGISGAAVPAVDDGTGKMVCPLVFTTNTTGAGIDTAIVDAITKLATFVNFKTVWLEARDNTETTFDERRFFKRGIPVSFATPLPAGCAAPSIGDLLPEAAPDGIFDSFTNLCPGTTVRFLLEMVNTEVPATCSDQVFAFKIVVMGDRTVETDARVVTVRVPGDVALCK